MAVSRGIRNAGSAAFVEAVGGDQTHSGRLGHREADREVVGIGVAGRVLAAHEVAVAAAVGQAAHGAAVRLAAGGGEGVGHRAVRHPRRRGVAAGRVLVGRQAQRRLRRPGSQRPGRQPARAHRRRGVGWRRIEDPALERQDLYLRTAEDGGGDTGLPARVERSTRVMVYGQDSVEIDLVIVALGFQAELSWRSADTRSRGGQQRKSQTARMIRAIKSNFPCVGDGQVAAAVSCALHARGDARPTGRARILIVGDLRILIRTQRRCDEPCLGVQTDGVSAIVLLQRGPSPWGIPHAAFRKRILYPRKAAGDVRGRTGY